MAEVLDAKRFKNVPMSLPVAYVIALEKLAAMDGHTNRSAIVRRLISREAREQFADDWITIQRDSLIEVS